MSYDTVLENGALVGLVTMDKCRRVPDDSGAGKTNFRRRGKSRRPAKPLLTGHCPTESTRRSRSRAGQCRGMRFRPTVLSAIRICRVPPDPPSVRQPERFCSSRFSTGRSSIDVPFQSGAPVSAAARAITCAETAVVSIMNAPMLSARITTDTSGCRIASAAKETPESQRRRLGRRLHAGEHIGHADHADTREERQRRSRYHQTSGDPIDHGRSRSRYRAYATVPTKLTRAMTIATSRNACCPESPGHHDEHADDQNADEIERDHPIGQSRPAHQPDKCRARLRGPAS